MSIILGISPHFINNAAALIVDGRIVYACEEERLNREKKTRKFPILSIQEALKFHGITMDDVDQVALSVNAGIYLEHLDSTQSDRLRYRGEMLYSVPSHLMQLASDNSVERTRQLLEFKNGKKLELEWVEHHLAHAASSFYPSPHETAAILSVDGFGEKACVLFAKGEGNKIHPLMRQEFPHSLGCFYAAMTEFLGFQPYSDEWKVMGASPYGDPKKFYQKLRDLFILKENGGFEMELSYFNFYQFNRDGMFSDKLMTHLGLKPNEKDCEMDAVYYDLAAATQLVTEEIMNHMLTKLHQITNEKAVCLSGGVAFNSVVNGKVVADTPFESVFVPPMPDDSGCSVGAALYLYHHMQNNPRTAPMISNYFGPGYSDEVIEEALQRFKIKYQRVENVCAVAAKSISEGKIIGWFQGRLEFGDRALGNRSILADPRDPTMKDKVNATIKYRERFRPFAPSMLAEYVDEYFENASATPFMEKVFKVKSDKRALVPAVTHEDGSGRLQTVTKEQNGLYYNLISEVNKITGVPIVLNTSFNVKGEPVVCSPQDAIKTFYNSGLDALFMGNFVVLK